MMHPFHYPCIHTYTAPYKIGFTFGILAAVSAIPLVFDLQTVLFFNEHFAKSDLPEGGIADLDTVWKVGAFSWGYMEVCIYAEMTSLLAYRQIFTYFLSFPQPITSSPTLVLSPSCS